MIDGVYHINVYSKGQTKIGRFYSNFSKTPIYLQDGLFYSIEAYWYWLITDGKSPKDTFGYDAKGKGKRFDRIKNIDEDKIKKAIDIKLKNNLGFIYENDNFDLPLEHYYLYGDKRVEGGYEWIIEHLELRRKQLKEYFNNKK